MECCEALVSSRIAEGCLHETLLCFLLVFIMCCCVRYTAAMARPTHYARKIAKTSRDLNKRRKETKNFFNKISSSNFSVRRFALSSL